jgi:hypothetical protein
MYRGTSLTSPVSPYSPVTCGYMGAHVGSEFFLMSGYKIPASIERHERDEIVPLDLQHPFDGVGLKFSIHIRTCFAIRACSSDRN